MLRKVLFDWERAVNRSFQVFIYRLTLFVGPGQKHCVAAYRRAEDRCRSCVVHKGEALRRTEVATEAIESRSDGLSHWCVAAVTMRMIRY